MADERGKAGWLQRVAARAEALMAWLGFTFVARWDGFERGYRRPYARLALRLRFGFYPLLALAALAWLAGTGPTAATWRRRKTRSSTR